jgi:hypothetical protein
VTRSGGERALRALLYLGGAVAGGAGLHTMVSGAKSVPGEGEASPPLESELRYYGGFYLAYGIAALRLAPAADRDPAAVRRLAAALFAAGLARAGGWLVVARPHPLQRALLAVELAAPAAIVALQAAIAES